MSESYDYIIVGAGSAGCVLANRISADPANRVLLIEAGGENKAFMVSMPKGIGKLVMDPEYSLSYPIRDAEGKTVETWQRGRGLGGSSAINGMIYVRGQPEDYQRWEKESGSEWGWPKMKAAFRAIEDHELGDDGVRGVGGPVHITTNKFRYPLAEAAIEAGVQMGLPRHEEDLNREEQEGIGYYCYNIKRGKRQSAAVAFLDPVRARKNLVIRTGITVDRVVFSDRRACGVEARRSDGSKIIFSARAEVILAAGTIVSPKLLQLSGIGPAAILHRHGIAVRQDSPDVGRRILEHMGLMAVYGLRNERGINHRLYGAGLFKSVLEYLAFKSGPLANGAMEVGAFIKTDPLQPTPNAQFFISGWTLKPAENKDTVAPMQSVQRTPGISISAQLIGLESEASLAIGGSDPDAPIDIRPNWLSTPGDRQAAIDLLRYIRRFVQQPALARVIGEEMVPGIAVQSDEDILSAIREQALCGTHAVRSCRMGRDQASVVDERLRVRGVQGLRVVDCSIMPGLISGNTNGPAMATAWRAADLILEDARLRNAA